jgi:tRNA-dihydrouridine synthase B
MQIGSIHIDNLTVLAPLAGITNLPMRLLAKDAGCGLVCSEMVSANGLVYGAAKTRQMLESTPAEKPLSLQIFGSDPAVMAEAARIVEASGADILDINCGCSVKKILKSDAGAALMKDLPRTAAILKSVRQAIRIPMTLKIRSGWDESGQQAIELSCIAQDCGADAIAVHPRTARQGFRGRADWSLINHIKTLLTIPVIGNGDVTCAEDALRLKAETGCDAVMVGRAAIGHPLIFAQINDLLAGRPMRPVTIQDRIQVMIRYVKDSVQHLGETRTCYMLRSRLAWFVKGLPCATRFRQSIRSIASEQEALALITAFADAVGPQICLEKLPDFLLSRSTDKRPAEKDGFCAE